MVSVKDIGLNYSVFDFLGGGVMLDSIRLNRPVVHLAKDAQGWNLGRLLKKERKEADREGPGRPIAIGEIGITDGSVFLEGAPGPSSVELPSRIERLNATLGFEYKPVNYTVRIGHLSFQSPDRDFRLADLSGTISTREDSIFLEKLAIRTAESALSIDGSVRSYQHTPVLDLRVSSEKLALRETGRLVPALLRYPLQPAFEISAKGPLSGLRLVFNTRSSAGQLSGDVVTDLTVPERRIEGTIDLRHLDLAPLLKATAQHSDITGRALVDLRLTGRSAPNPLAAIDGRWQVVAPRVVAFGYEARDVTAKGRFDRGVLHVDGKAAAYGGRATFAGTIVPGTPLRLDLRGEATHLDLRNLPRALKVPAVPSDLNVAYRLAGSVNDLTADATFRPSELAGASIAGGGTAGVTLQGKEIAYRADATVRDLDIQRIGRRVPDRGAVRGSLPIGGEWVIRGERHWHRTGADDAGCAGHAGRFLALRRPGAAADLRHPRGQPGADGEGRRRVQRFRSGGHRRTSGARGRPVGLVEHRRHDSQPRRRDRSHGGSRRRDGVARREPRRRDCHRPRSRRWAVCRRAGRYPVALHHRARSRRERERARRPAPGRRERPRVPRQRDEPRDRRPHVQDRGVREPDGRRTPDGQPAVAPDQGYRFGQQPAVRHHQRDCGEDNLRRPYSRTAAGPRGGQSRTRRRRCCRWPAAISPKRPHAPRGRTRRWGSTQRSSSRSGRWPPVATS